MALVPLLGDFSQPFFSIFRFCEASLGSVGASWVGGRPPKKPAKPLFILEIIKKLLASHLENSSPLLLPRSWLGCVFVQSFGAAEFSDFSCPPDGFLGFDPDGSGTAAGSGTETHAGILAIIKK